MKITTKKVIDMETEVVILHEFYEYDGTPDLFCGASPEQQAAYAQQTRTAGTLEADFNKIFSGNQNILDTLTAPLKNIVNLGVGQFGMTHEEEAARRTEAAETIGAAGRAATGKAREALAAMGGGNYIAPSGSREAVEAGLAEETALKQAEAQQKITEQGYQLGRENFFTASKELAAAPGELENPATNMESGIVGAEGLAGKTANEIAQANNAWIGPLAGLVGDVGKVALGPGGAITKAITG